MAQFDTMTGAMPPPLLPGFSLRVQLFAPNAYSSSDRPIRCFRVVTDRSATIREFCQEASRIHEINYGEPLAIKKCQDDQEFDVTQTEIVGTLFASMSTIRVIQASSYPSIRDSVPPTSALRYDPTSLLGKKRGRDASPRTNGATPANSFGGNKRRRVSQLDPDEPIPSREESLEDERITRRTPDNIPNSQESVILGTSNGHFTHSRYVRPELPCIAETPPPPSALARHAQTQADQIRQKHGSARPQFEPEIQESSPARAFSERQPSQQRAKSASYHIPRPTERGTSVSTAATSPLSADQHSLPSNGVGVNKRKPILPSSIAKRSEGRKNRSANEDSLYENITSDDEGPAAVLKANKGALKIKNSPRPGLSGMERSNDALNTPPNARRRSRDQAITPGELPLTPNSKERESRKKQKEEAESSRKVRIAAAEAAEQRNREAAEERRLEELRRAEEEREIKELEEARQIEAEREAREEQERVKVEAFKKGEAERLAVAKKQQEEERMEAEKQRVAKEKGAAEQVAREKAAAKAKQATEAAKESARVTSASPEVGRKANSSSPALSRNSPFVRAPSTTGFFPVGRKSSLKSSSGVRSSPPATPRVDTTGVGIETQMPLPKSANRRVSFVSSAEQKTPPMNPAIGDNAKAASVPRAASKSASRTPILPPQPSYKRIVPPTSAGRRSSSEKSEVTPLPIATSNSRNGASPTVTKKHSPIPVPSRRTVTPVPPPVAREQSKSVSVGSLEPEPVIKASDDSGSDEDKDSSSSEEDFEKDIPKPSGTPIVSKEIHRRTSSDVVNGDSRHGSNSDVDMEDAPKESSPARAPHRKPSRSPAVTAEETDDEEDVETASHSNSSRDSRSPVIYSQHEQAQQRKIPARSLSRDSEEASEIAESDHSRSKTGNTEGNSKDSDSESESESDSVRSNSDNEDTIVQAPRSSAQSQKLPSPVLSKSTPASVARTSQNPTTKRDAPQKPSKDESPASSDLSIQEALNQQLTSSVYEARTSVPPTSSQILPSTKPAPKAPVVTLTGLAQKRQTFSSSTANTTPTTKGRPLKLQEQEEETSDEESEEDEDDESDDNSANQQRAKPTSHQARRPSKPESYDSDSSSVESEEAVARIRNELLAQVESMKSQSQISIPSPRPYKSTPDSTKSKKSKDKYLSGYSFSQPM